ncbi:3-hydroxyacyl-CoA dehydrogenase family protein [uncultured Enterovirga sp.]|uniref:3-hydroxyacyl-CoA dehydrogenase family protein n=1 Tax=uncultured Enterovirga sp. TaxID=2026352 RepID=UPI0035C976FD
MDAGERSDGREDATSRLHVVVVGAGRMGADIALAFAIGGWRCKVVESDPAIRDRARAYWQREMSRLAENLGGGTIACHASLGDADLPAADLVVEAVFEDLELKHALLDEIEPRVGPGAILATNTSSLRITDVTSRLKLRERSAGLHFMVPAHVMPAVEITRGDHTSDRTMAQLVSWMKQMEKVPIVLDRDITGMLINRIQHAMYREIYHLIDEGYACPQMVDLAVRFGFGLRYHILGPVVSRDIHGLPVHLAASREIYPTLHNGSEPSRRLRELVEDGHRGVTTGKGFYEWDPDTVPDRLKRFSELLEETIARMTRRGEPTEF